MSQHCALTAQKANWILGTSKAVQPAGRGRGSALLLCAVRPRLECCVQMGSAQYRRDMEPRDGTPPCEDRLRAGVCSMEKGKLRGELSGSCQYPEGL